MLESKQEAFTVVSLVKNGIHQPGVPTPLCDSDGILELVISGEKRSCSLNLLFI